MFNFFYILQGLASKNKQLWLKISMINDNMGLVSLWGTAQDDVSNIHPVCSSGIAINLITMKWKKLSL